MTKDRLGLNGPVNRFDRTGSQFTQTYWPGHNPISQQCSVGPSEFDRGAHLLYVPISSLVEMGVGDNEG